MIRVVWKPGNSFFERKHGGNWRKLYRKDRLLSWYLPCLEEEIISKQMPRDSYTKEQTNTEIPAINPWTTCHRSVRTKAGTAQFPEAVRAVFHFSAPVLVHWRGGWQLPCAPTPGWWMGLISGVWHRRSWFPQVNWFLLAKPVSNSCCLSSRTDCSAKTRHPEIAIPLYPASNR